jgi:hypothetical protein
MPRQKNPVVVRAEFIDEPAPLAIPIPHKEHEHRIDPYRTLPGAIPDAIVPTGKRKRGRPRKDDAEAMVRAEAKRKLQRYDRYLDALIAMQGDTDAALAVVYGISPMEAQDRHDDLLVDVQAGVPASSMSEMMKRRDLDKAARVTILRKWVFSANPAASLKALDMLGDLEEGQADAGSYEMYVKLALQE